MFHVSSPAIAVEVEAIRCLVEAVIKVRKVETRRWGGSLEHCLLLFLSLAGLFSPPCQ